MKRSAFITMIDTTPAGESRTYELIGDGVTDLSISYIGHSTLAGLSLKF